MSKFIIISIVFLTSCSAEPNRYNLTGNECKIWRPDKWDSLHYKCFDKNGNGAMYKLQNGKLIHVPYIDDLVYDFNWKILNDSTIAFGNSSYKIEILSSQEYFFSSSKGYIMRGIDATAHFNFEKCDCRDLKATQK
jgi:hypothetical protein